LDNQKCISFATYFRNHGQVKGSKVFDVWWGYNNVWIWSGDEWKAAFRINWGLYQPMVMFFGMCNSLATFQSMMDEIFEKKIEDNLIIVYMDDILAFSKMIHGLKKIKWIILEKAWENDLYFKAKKCKFGKLKTKYLGLVIEEGKLAMDPAKLKGILEWRIANAKNTDYDAAEVIKELLEQGPKEVKKDLEEWKVEEFEGKNVLFYKGKNYVPIDVELWREIVCRYHDHPMAGHLGELQTFDLVKEHYWWPGLWVFVKNYVQGCGSCQQFKINRNPSKPAFMPIEGARSTRPFAGCSMDLITDLPPVDSCDSIFIVVDRGNTKGGNSHSYG
jgi:Integrase zinc binding domain/Reverse transcriptase (RNA-dependent DNA polymerase)